jgi:hypothetical protein
VVEDLRRLLRVEMLTHRLSSGRAAAHFPVHRRTLNRRLRAQGEGFKTVADQVRFAVARELLSDTDIPFGSPVFLRTGSVYACFCKVVGAIAEPLPRQGEAKTLRRDGLLSQPIKL